MYEMSILKKEYQVRNSLLILSIKKSSFYCMFHSSIMTLVSDFDCHSNDIQCENA